VCFVLTIDGRVLVAHKARSGWIFLGIRRKAVSDGLFRLSNGIMSTLLFSHNQSQDVGTVYGAGSRFTIEKFYSQLDPEL
jgi:hypothetical protein